MEPTWVQRVRAVRLQPQEVAKLGTLSFEAKLMLLVGREWCQYRRSAYISDRDLEKTLWPRVEYLLNHPESMHGFNHITSADIEAYMKPYIRMGLEYIEAHPEKRPSGATDEDLATLKRMVRDA